MIDIMKTTKTMMHWGKMEKELDAHGHDHGLDNVEYISTNMDDDDLFYYLPYIYRSEAKSESAC